MLQQTMAESSTMDDSLKIQRLDKKQLRSTYDWLNLLWRDQIIGKVRTSISGRQVIIYSILIFPEFERRGFARQAIEAMQDQFETIIADRVRFTAVGFWEKLGFKPMDEGNYRWRKPSD